VGDDALNMLVSFVMLGAVYVPLERSFRARRQGHVRPGLALDLAYFTIQFMLMLGVFLSLHDWMGLKLRGPAAVTVTVSELPLAAQALLVVVAGDLALYWGHRLSHRVPFLWRLHGVHHTSTHLDWIAAYREHPLDGIYSQLMFMAPCAFFGVQPYTIMPVLVFRGLCAVLVHSNVRLPLGPFGVLFGDPVLHRWHHANRVTEHNFANLAPYLDLLFGTHHRPAGEDYALGADDLPQTLLPQLVPGLDRGLALARPPRAATPAQAAAADERPEATSLAGVPGA
jgi:sterol desaturase/sphingolipid hydroxylase (fatty acid hydroxylase superfamily)